MSLRACTLALGSAALLTSLSLVSSDAHACGGCFHGEPVPGATQSTVVTGHRMAVSISMDRTVLWDQISYAGDPEEFAWVLPVKAGAKLELANDAFFEALDAATSAAVGSPQITCNDDFGGGDGSFSEGDGNSGCDAFACGSFAEAGGDYYGGGAGGGSNTVDQPPDPITVVHQESIGPYETVTLSSTEPGALFNWLDGHGYAVADDIKPIVDAYEAEGFDFIALRLIPGANVRQMQPVRVVSPGASPVLPLRMVAAGAGMSMPITLFVIGEGRWETQNFVNAVIDPTLLSWDFDSNTSNFATVRDEALKANDGFTWLTSYSRQRALLSSVSDDFAGGTVVYNTTAGSSQSTIASLYAQQAGENVGRLADTSCFMNFYDQNIANSMSKVSGACLKGGAGGGAGGGGGAGAGGAGAGGAGAGGAGAGGAGAGGAGAGGAGAGGGGEGDCVVGDDEIDAAKFACGDVDDVAVALVGLHPAAVWVTRLEANLSRLALEEDLALQAEINQVEQSNFLRANGVQNPPCTDWSYSGTGAPPPGMDQLQRKGPPRSNKRELLVLAWALAFAGSLVARRLRKPSFRMARTQLAFAKR